MNNISIENLKILKENYEYKIKGLESIINDYKNFINGINSHLESLEKNNDQTKKTVNQ